MFFNFIQKDSALGEKRIFLLFCTISVFVLCMYHHMCFAHFRFHEQYILEWDKKNVFLQMHTTLWFGFLHTFFHLPLCFEKPTC